MTEKQTKRTYQSQPAHHPQVRLEAVRTPALDQVTPEMYARLNRKQREEMVSKLIDFLKSF
jgi:hypothetical protein